MVHLPGLRTQAAILTHIIFLAAPAAHSWPTGPHFPEYNVTGGPRWRLFFRYCTDTYLLRIIWYISEAIGFPLPMAETRPFSDKDPFRSLVAGYPVCGSPRDDANPVIRDHRCFTAFQVSRKFFRAGKYRGDSERALRRGQRIPTLSGQAQGESIAELPLSGRVEYEGSEQLIRLGLLREDPGWIQVHTAGNDMADIKDRAFLSAAGSA